MFAILSIVAAVELGSNGRICVPLWVTAAMSALMRSSILRISGVLAGF